MRRAFLDLTADRPSTLLAQTGGLMLSRRVRAAPAGLGASDEFDEPLPMMGAGALFGSVYGLGIGTVVGARSPRSPDVIYYVD